MILAGDIGGTNTRLAYFAEENGAYQWKQYAKYPSKDYDKLEDIISDFIAKHNLPVQHASFGIAGVVIDGTVHATNLPWVVSTVNLSNLLTASNVHLLNDLEANTWGIFTLKEKDFARLNNVSQDSLGNIALISAGTGLGEAGALLFENTLHPLASEGGHTDFGPRNAVQDSLLQYLRNKYNHVSWERVLSGNGLFNIYCFLRDCKYGEEAPWLTEQLAKSDAAAAITENALANKSPICSEALDIFCEIYGAKAGNLALTLTANGGVFLGGGIAPKIVSKLQSSNFMREFLNKGRMNEYLKLIPVKVILNDNAALLGACKYALQQAGLNKEIKTASVIN